MGGAIIAASQGYTSKVAARNGIASVKSNAASAPIEDLTTQHV
ncbi:YegP family protein [Rhodococcus phenolicus]